MSHGSKVNFSQRCVHGFSEQDLSPSKEDFEALGFTFQYSSNNSLGRIFFPPGWVSTLYGTLKDSCYHTRGEVLYAPDAQESLVCSITLLPRFSIAYMQNANDTESVIVRDLKGDSIIYTAGSYSNLKRRRHFWAKAERWLNYNYPLWKNVVMYWEDT